MSVYFAIDICHEIPNMSSKPSRYQTLPGKSRVFVQASGKTVLLNRRHQIGSFKFTNELLPLVKRFMF